MSTDLEKTIVDNLFKTVKKNKKENATKFDQYSPNFIYQADLLFLPNDNGYKYALVVVDIGSRIVDAEPLKTKQAEEIMKAFNEIFSRKPLQKKPKIVEVDAGTEFKGDVKKNLINQNIIVRTKKPYRHNQQAIVERKNQDIGVILFKRMIAEEILTGATSTSWIKYLPEVIQLINKKSLKPSSKKKNSDYQCKKDTCNAFEQGTIVRVALDAPVDVVSGKRLPGKFRSTDIRWSRTPRTIMETIIQPGQPPLYLLDDGKGGTDRSAAYTKNQLQLLPKGEKLPDPSLVVGQTENNITKFVIEKIMAKKKINNRIHYKVKWAGFPTSQATWEPRSTLIQDVPTLIQHFDNNNK